MTRELARTVRERAKGRCEYCLLPQFALPLPFQFNHIIAEQHGGTTVSGNLALACTHCNRYKGPNVAGFDPESGELVRLFHRRRDVWTSIFDGRTSHFGNNTDWPSYRAVARDES